MAKSSLLDTCTINYLDLIGNGKQYRVPPYQRDYSWGEEQWEDLWNDIVELRCDADQCHYLGALVVEESDNREFLIIDGQQRLATLSLLALAVIKTLGVMAKDGLDSDDNTERSRELRNRFLGEKDPASLIERSRLHLNDTDNAFYQDRLIQLKDPLNTRKLPKSNLGLWQCFRYFEARIQGDERLRTDGQVLASLVSKTVARQLVFILITVDDEMNAYTVFETLNARGLELTTTDLLKNYLFSKVTVRAELEFLQRRWQSLLETVGQGRFPEFLRYHLLCEKPKIRRQRLFKLVRDRVRTVDDVFRLLDDLEKRAELFAAILDPNHGYWAELPGAKGLVAELRLFGVRQPMPLLFAAWEGLPRQDFVRVLKLVSIISFRFAVVSKLNTNSLEPVYHRAAKAVLDGSAGSLSKVFECVKSIYVGDEKMQQDFSTLEIDTRGSKKKLAKYVLARLEGDASGRQCDPETDPGTIEHVLPENPGDRWDATYSRDRWEHGIYRLGNLTLLEGNLNREAANEVYSKKVPLYRSSQYSLTLAIPEMAPEEWTEELIIERQERLARRATSVWRLDYC